MAKTEVRHVVEMPGELSKSEAIAYRRDPQNNLALNRETAARVAGIVSTLVREHLQTMMEMHVRWMKTERAIAGNTLAKGGPLDAHICEIYKAREVIVPRIEELLLGSWPWVRVEPRREVWRSQVKPITALTEFYYDQAESRYLIGPNAHDMLVAQAGIYHTQWENEFRERTVRSFSQEFEDNGASRHRIESRTENALHFAGPRPRLVDPMDFLIDLRALNAQDASYVGHRCVMTIDEVRRIGEEQGWANLGRELRESKGESAFGVSVEAFKYGRDPRTLSTDERVNYMRKHTGRPDQVELTVIYLKLNPFGKDDSFHDYRVVMANGSLVLDIRRNPHDGDMRPYAISHIAKTGRSFYSTGRLDNALRFEMHADRIFQDLLHNSSLAGRPIIFTESTGRQIPKSLLHVQPFSIIQGVGRVQMTELPTGALQAGAGMLSLVQRQFESVTGVSQLQYGQDVTGGTATESVTALQEANRRLTSDYAACARGLSELLDINYRLAQQYGTEDVEVPVVGKSRAALGRGFIKVGPQDLIADVKFRILGLDQARTHGSKAAGYAQVFNAVGPYMLQVGSRINWPKAIHAFATEAIGRDAADQMISIPADASELVPQSLENSMLMKGPVEVSPEDNHQEHLDDSIFQALSAAARSPESRLPRDVRAWILNHELQHNIGLQRQKDEDRINQVQANRLPREAGGQRSIGGVSPQAGGLSDAMGRPPGQSSGQTPGPASADRTPRGGSASRPSSQASDLESL